MGCSVPTNAGGCKQGGGGTTGAEGTSKEQVHVAYSQEVLVCTINHTGSAIAGGGTRRLIAVNTTWYFVSGPRSSFVKARSRLKADGGKHTDRGHTSACVAWLKTKQPSNHACGEGGREHAPTTTPFHKVVHTCRDLRGGGSAST